MLTTLHGLTLSLRLLNPDCTRSLTVKSISVAVQAISVISISVLADVCKQTTFVITLSTISKVLVLQWHTGDASS